MQRERIPEGQSDNGEPTSAGKSRVADYFGSFGLSYLIGLALLVALIYAGGVWNILANTRALDLLIKGGIIKYHDGNQGVVEGLDDLEYYVATQDPIDWRLVAVAFGLYFVWFGFKAIQCHGIAKFVGLKGNLGQHARAFLFGNCIDRLMPYRIGEAATATALEGQGDNPKLASKAFGVAGVLVLLFEIFLFAAYGVLMITWSLWFTQMFWALVLFGIGYLFLRGGRPREVIGNVKAFWSDFGVTVRALMNQPTTLLWLGFLGALSMLLDDIAPFVIAKAFTSDNVIINVPFIVIQSAVVAGYISKQAPVTPYGVGQFEWAFAAALYLSGLGFPEAATLAILDSVVRNLTGLVVLGMVTLWYGIEANFPTVLRLFARTKPELAVS